VHRYARSIGYAPRLSTLPTQVKICTSSPSVPPPALLL
jgi:hypothetical protein